MKKQYITSKKFLSAITAASAAALISTQTLAVNPDIDPASPDWEKHGKSTDEVTISTKDFPGSDYKAFKGETVLNGSIDAVIAVIKDINSCMNWVHQCADNELLSEDDFNNFMTYQLNDMPFPTTDRDLVFDSSISRDADTGVVSVDFNAIEGGKPVDDKKVRITHTIVNYTLTAEGDKTRMVWVQHSDPAGSIPTFVVDAMVWELPLRSLENLNELVQDDQYKNAKLIIGDDGQIAGLE